MVFGDWVLSAQKLDAIHSGIRIRNHQTRRDRSQMRVRACSPPKAVSIGNSRAHCGRYASRIFPSSSTRRIFSDTVLLSVSYRSIDILWQTVKPCYNVRLLPSRTCGDVRLMRLADAFPVVDKGSCWGGATYNHFSSHSALADKLPAYHAGGWGAVFPENLKYAIAR